MVIFQKLLRKLRKEFKTEVIRTLFETFRKGGIQFGLMTTIIWKIKSREKKDNLC